MSRPRLRRRVRCNPNVVCFKPRGMELKDLEVINLELEELEAFRLRHLLDLEQREAAKEMAVSTSTYQRMLYLAYKKIAIALVEGGAIKITKNY